MAARGQESRARRSTRSRASQNSDGDERDDRWWVIVASSIPEVGSGRYGVWEERPEVKTVWEGVVLIDGKEGEPQLFVILTDTLTISIGKIEHFSAAPVTPDQASEAS